MRLTEQQLEDKFRLAFMQFMSIDESKSQHFGSLVQGFFAIKVGKNAKIVPFQFYDDESKLRVIEVCKKLKTGFLGVSFVQNYIHYHDA